MRRACDLIAEDDVADGEVKESKQENHGSNDAVGHGDHQNENVIWNQRVVFKLSGRPCLLQLLLRFAHKLFLQMVHGQWHHARQFQSIANKKPTIKTKKISKN